MRASFLVILVGLVGLAGLALPGCQSPSTEPESAGRNAGINVLLVTIDTLRPDHLSAYGYPRQTSPRIDELASKGVSFDLAFTYWPKTRGSFAAMFTGLYASQHGLTVRDRDLPDFNSTLAEAFQKAGYRTGAALDNGNLDSRLGFGQGFDEYLETWTSTGRSELDRTEAITRYAEDFLSKEDASRPFFLWLHYVNPHAPYEPPPEHLELFSGDGLVPRGSELAEVVGFHGGVNRRMKLEGARSWGDYVDRYDAEIRVADEHVGRVLKSLSESPHAGTTIVALTSDHGESLGEHGYFFDHGDDLFNPSLRIPLILSFPGILPSGERVSAPVTSLDLYPTLLDLAQLPFPTDPPGLQGSSVLPVVRGTKSNLKDHLFFQNDRHLTAISNGRLKLLHRPGAEGTSDCLELYDLYRDPEESQDRYQGSEGYVAPLEAELSSFLTRSVAWQQETSARREPAKSDAALSDATRESLEVLGYVQEETPAASLPCRPR
ncbi:MAG TPA: sulfatase [Vicinamibacteria bacterium]